MQDEDQLIPGASVRLGRAANGQVLLHLDDEIRNVGNVMAAFPLTKPGKMVSVRDEEGEEIGIIDDVAGLDPASRQIMMEELERSYFMPRILDILDIKEELNVVLWEVETDRGARKFEVRNVRQNVRRMGKRRFVVKDVDGNRYEIRDWTELPRVAQSLIWNYV